jgi:DNA-binding transcriptional LysR family regulator
MAVARRRVETAAVPLDRTTSPPGLELRHLRCWLAVADELDLERAALRLGVSAGELRRTIRDLEDDLAVELLSGRELLLSTTPAGELFTEGARRVLGALDATVAETRRSGGIGATLRLGCVPDLPLARLQGFLGALYGLDAALHAEVTHERSTEQLRALRRGHLDLAIVHDTGAEAGIDTVALYPGERFAAYLPVGHPRAHGSDSLRAADLAGETLLLAPRAADPALTDRLLEVLAEGGLRFHGVRETRGADLRDLLFAVADGGGVLVAPASVPELVGQAAAIAASRPLEPPLFMPDTMLAWRADPTPQLGRAIATARAVAQRLYGG